MILNNFGSGKEEESSLAAGGQAEEGKKQEHAQVPQEELLLSDASSDPYQDLHVLSQNNSSNMAAQSDDSFKKSQNNPESEPFQQLQPHPCFNEDQPLLEQGNSELLERKNGSKEYQTPSTTDNCYDQRISNGTGTIHESWQESAQKSLSSLWEDNQPREAQINDLDSLQNELYADQKEEKSNQKDQEELVSDARSEKQMQREELKREQSYASGGFEVNEMPQLKEFNVRRSAREKSVFNDAPNKDQKKKKESLVEENYLGKRKRPLPSSKSRNAGKKEVPPESEKEPAENQNNKSHRKNSPRVFPEIMEVFENMFAFDWDLKDISNLKHAPYNELTHSIFWFYVNAFYFPFNILQTIQKPLEDFIEPLVQKLNSNSNQQLPDQKDGVPEEVRGLLFDGKFQKFKKQFKEFQELARQESFKKQGTVEESGEKEEAKSNLPPNTDGKDRKGSGEMEDDERSNQDRKMQLMLDLKERELSKLCVQNRNNLENLFLNLKTRYEGALDQNKEEFDRFPYNEGEIFSYGQEFLSYIDPRYIQDVRENQEWYLENSNEVLLNIGYPSRQEKDFLKHIEFVQQKYNDQKYVKILQQIQENLENGMDGNGFEDARYQKLSTHQRVLATQEDAQCTICNNGDYEEDDQIVFCGNCNMPVHQNCYGIDQLPEGDWICYNCDIFGMKKGLMVKCLFCCKKGGAMKPTNVFSSKQKCERFNQQSHKNHHKHHKAVHKKMNSFLASSDNQSPENKYEFSLREDKSFSLNQILKKEIDFQNERDQEGDLARENELELRFQPQEKVTQIPTDYSFFLQKNEQILESPQAPHTETLYEWVHISCSSWIPGLHVTPKTPVKMNKIENKSFQLPCIICMTKDGACMQCQTPKCDISFHIECARRANYYMEIEKKDRDKVHKIYCEKHRPLKIVKEMMEKEKSAIDEVNRFCKVIEKAMEIYSKYKMRALAADKEHKSSRALGKSSPSLKLKGDVGKGKKWREKEKKLLFERVKEKYLLFKKLRLNIIRVQPAKKTGKKQSQRKRSKKKQNKKANLGGREGLRSGNASNEAPAEEQEGEEADQEMKDEAKEEEKDNLPEEEEKQSDYKIQIETQEGELETYYKFGTPMFQQDIDWAITLSRNDFPWNEVKFGNFSAKDCYEKYVSLVKDGSVFLKKVLGMKEKFKKMMENQINLQLHQPAVTYPLNSAYYDYSMYCFCFGKVADDIFVKCDGEDKCPYKGWFHPSCTEDLRAMSKEELDDLQEWFCSACQARLQAEQAQQQQEELSENRSNQSDNQSENQSENQSDNQSDNEEMESSSESEDEGGKGSQGSVVVVKLAEAKKKVAPAAERYTLSQKSEANDIVRLNNMGYGFMSAESSHLSHLS